MNEQEILENNKLIAEFMGCKQVDDSYEIDCLPFAGHINSNGYGLHYNSSWDWLMPVVEKIENIEISEFKPFAVNIECAECTIKDYRGMTDSVSYCENSTKIEATWLAVVEFIKWYNQHKS